MTQKSNKCDPNLRAISNEIEIISSNETPSLDDSFRGYVRYPALSGVIWRYLALSRAISRNLAQFGPFQSQKNVLRLRRASNMRYELLDTASRTQPGCEPRRRAGCAAMAKNEVKCSNGPSEPATLDLSKCGCHGSDLERLKDER